MSLTIDSRVASYFCLYSKSAHSPVGIITLPRQRAPTFEGDQARILKVATALAFICVGKPDSEVYAVGIQVSDTSTVIHLAENNEINSNTLAYLDNVLEQLMSISKAQPYRHDFPHLDTTIRKDQEDKLRTTILKHTIEKFLKSLTKRDQVWDDRVAAIKQNLESSSDSTNSQLWAGIQAMLEVIYFCAKTYETSLNGDVLSVLSDATAKLEKTIRRNKDQTGIDSCLSVLDKDSLEPSSTMDSLLEGDIYTDLDSDVENANVNFRPGFSMKRYLYRIILLNIHIRRLLDTALSRHFKALFQKKPGIKCCAPITKTVQIDPREVLQGLPNQNGILVMSEGQETLQAPLHAELQVFEALIATCLAGETPYWVIGVSELMCVGCYTLIAEALPKVLKDHHESPLEEIAIQGCHGKLYPWVAPDLSFANNRLTFDLHNEICLSVEKTLRHALYEYVERRRFSDTNPGNGESGSEGSNNEEDDNPLKDVALMLDRMRALGYS